MRYGDYVTMTTPKDFEDLNRILEQHDRGLVNLSVPPGKEQALLLTPVSAHATAPPAPGRFPLILYFGGLDDSAHSNSVLAEFLASYGYVVAAIPMLGPTDHQTAQARTPIDIENSVRDMEYAWSLLRQLPNVDNAKLGVAGQSLGGIETLIFAMRNGNVSAVVGLDGTYGFSGATRVLTDFYDYAPQNMRAAFLDLRRPDGENPDLDLSVVNKFRYADRYLITLRKMHHSDFTSFAMIAQTFGLGNSPGYVSQFGWSRETGYYGYQRVCEIVRDFFQEKLKRDPNAAGRLVADVAHADGGVLNRTDGLPALPSPDELLTLMSQRGFDVVTQIIDQYRRNAPDETLAKESALNALGYNLISQKRFADAIAAMRLSAYIYPISANAADSLGDAYLAAGEKQRAKDAFHRALEVVTADTSLTAEEKQSLTEGDQRKLRDLGE
jgi:hypothetical protein